MTNPCVECKLNKLRVHNIPVLPDIKEGSSILFLSDFPMQEDLEYGLVSSGLNRRTAMVHRLMKETKLDQDEVSHATSIRCITKSKSVITTEEYERCGKILLHEIASTGIVGVVCFGSIAGKLITGKDVANIEKSRGMLHETRVEGLHAVITYSLSILTDPKGCGGCGSSVQPTLTRKDISLLKRELKNRKLI